MLYPSVTELQEGAKKGEGQISRYSLVVATAKYARKIAADAELRGEKMDDNPVRTAVLAIDKGIKANVLEIVEPE